MRRPIFSFLGLISILLSVSFASGSASQEVFTQNFHLSDLAFEKAGGYDRVEMVDAIVCGEPGTPWLPVKFVQIAIPTELEIERVEIVSSEYQQLAGTYRIHPAQPFYPISGMPGKEEAQFVQPDPSVYSLSNEYPSKLAEVTNNGFLGGQHIAGVALYPLQYIPAEGKLILYTRIEFKLIFKPSSRSPVPVNKRSLSTAEFYTDQVRNLVINPEAIRLGVKGSISQGQEVDYLIITESSFIPAYEQLAEWKTLKGISTQIKEIPWVLSNYDGLDDQEKIRNCIRDYYSNYGTKWVLLGADSTTMPPRIVRMSNNLIACDLYFSDLDSNWDANSNQLYGEYDDEVDLYPDVYVGRVPSNDLSQAQTLVDKCLTYEIDPPMDYQTRILYAAELLWAETDERECKEFIDSIAVPDHFQATRLYESSHNLSWMNFRDALNAGQNIINHAGHGNHDGFSINPDFWTSSDMDNLINGPRSSLFYSLGCHTANFEKDCVGEHFLANPDGGGFAYCGNTHYGWGTPGYPLGGPGVNFDIHFFRSLFLYKNYQIGKTLGDSKLPFIPVSQVPGYYECYRWTEFTLVLLGEPTLELWTDIPSELSASHAPVCIVGMPYFNVDVVQDSALVSCVIDGSIAGRAYSSDGIARVYFDSPLTNSGVMHVTVTKHDHLAYRDSAFVIPPEGPYVIYHSHLVDDSQGNNNGVVNPDERILASITVKNLGREPAQNVTATLRENDNYVIVTDSVNAFGEIDSGMTATSLAQYAFEVEGSCPDTHRVKFTLEATDGQYTWATSFFQTVVKPDLVVTAMPETAVVCPGESSSIKLIFAPVGGFIWQVDLSYSSLPPGVTALLEPDQFLPPDSSVFTIQTALDAPPGIYPITITAAAAEISCQREIALGIKPPPYYGPLWHVATGGHDDIFNGSGDFPFRTIQKGIDSADLGDTVLVRKGNYTENINFTGKNILVASHFIFDGEESTIESTIIDGIGEGSVVTFDSGEDSSSVIRGFTLTRGYADYGGAVHCDSSSPTIAENFMLGNECWGSRAGCGIFCDNGSSPRIYRNLIAGCAGPKAVFLRDGSAAQVIGNTICDNTEGGISIEDSSAVLIKNNIVCSNVTYGIQVSESFCDISYNDIYDHDDDYSGIADQSGANGNIAADPLFVHQSAGDYHLTALSPCIDAGDSADPVPPGGGDRIDMGASEYLFVPDFYVAAPGTTVVHRGDSSQVKIVVLSFLGFDSPVQLSCSVLPPGVSGFFDPNPLTPEDTSYLVLYAEPDAPLAVCSITVAGTGAEITRFKDMVLGVAGPPYFGPVWHVSTTGSDLMGSGTVQFPFASVQRGIDCASHQDTVLVNEGRYLGNIDFSGKAVLVASHFILNGSYNTLRSTILDGNRQGSVITFASGEDSSSVIRGFTITGGYSTDGGGIFCYGSSPIIVENFLVENDTYGGYGGGGGIYCGYGSNAKIHRNVLVDCGLPEFILLEQESDVDLVNNTLCNGWDAISILSNSHALLKNNIINRFGCCGIRCYGGTWTIEYNDIFQNDPNYEGLPDQTGFNGNISADPLFLDWGENDLRLTLDSPCINAGDPTDSVPPLGGGRIDIGAFEFPSQYVHGDANGDGAVACDDVIYLINYLFRFGPAPYPFEAGDANGNGDINVGDIVYLIIYLYHGGPPPPAKLVSLPDFYTSQSQAQVPARVWLEKRINQKEGDPAQFVIKSSYSVDLAGIQVALEYEPKGLALDPLLPQELLSLQIFHSQRNGIIKVGILNLKGEYFIPASEDADLLVLKANPADLKNLVIKEAILVDRGAHILPVKIGTGDDTQDSRPISFELFQNYPNPFNPQTQIRYALSNDCYVKVTIYNILGRRVKVLVDGYQRTGYRSVLWDGKDEQGDDVASGIYFYKIQAGEFMKTKKMVLLK
jgi:parallel beta-helix repeat protein